MKNNIIYIYYFNYIKYIMANIIDTNKYWNNTIYVRDAYTFCNQTLELFYTSPILSHKYDIIQYLYDSIYINPHNIIYINVPQRATFDIIKDELLQQNKHFSDEFITKITKLVNLRDILTEILHEPLCNSLFDYEEFNCIPDYVIRTIFYFNDIVHNYKAAELLAKTFINLCRYYE